LPEPHHSLVFDRISILEMEKNSSYPSRNPSQKGHKKSSSNSRSSGKPGVHHSRIGSVKNNTTNYANNGSIHNFSSVVDNYIRTTRLGMQNSTLSYLASSASPTFSSIVDNYIRTSHSGMQNSTLSYLASYASPTFSSTMDNYIRSTHSGMQNSELSYLSYASRIENYMKSTRMVHSRISSFSSRVENDIKSTLSSDSYPS